MVCIHNLSSTPSCGYFIQYIWHIFIDGAVSVSSSYSCTMTATPPWHEHVTKSPTSNLCLGAFLKKSFTRSWYPTRYILWGNFLGRFFKELIISKFLGAIENRLYRHVRDMSDYRDILSGVGGGGCPIVQFETEQSTNVKCMSISFITFVCSLITYTIYYHITVYV